MRHSSFTIQLGRKEVGMRKRRSWRRFVKTGTSKPHLKRKLWRYSHLSRQCRAKEQCRLEVTGSGYDEGGSLRVVHGRKGRR
jgi:hypothetical protein